MRFTCVIAAFQRHHAAGPRRRGGTRLTRVKCGDERGRETRVGEWRGARSAGRARGQTPEESILILSIARLCWFSLEAKKPQH